MQTYLPVAASKCDQGVMIAVTQWAPGLLLGLKTQSISASSSVSCISVTVG